MLDFDKYLRPGESLERVDGVSLAFVGTSAATLVLLVVAVWLAGRAFIGLNTGSGFGAAMAPVTNAGFLLLTALVGVFALYVIAVLGARAIFTRYALTDSRVMRRSLFRIRAADLSHVQDVEVVQGLLGKVFGYGDVLVRTASKDGPLVLRNVDRPHEWFGEIHEAVRQGQATGTSSS